MGGGGGGGEVFVGEAWGVGRSGPRKREFLFYKQYLV